jgi:simple sugar transport system ATP-binding protein
MSCASSCRRAKGGSRSSSSPTHQVMHAMTVGDHFAVLIRGAKAADFKKGEMSREEITDLMAGGEAMAELEAEIETYMATHQGHPPTVEEMKN